MSKQIIESLEQPAPPKTDLLPEPSAATIVQEFKNINYDRPLFISRYTTLTSLELLYLRYLESKKGRMRANQAQSTLMVSIDNDYT